MRKNRKWMKQAVRSLLVLMLTFVLAVPVMAKAVDYCAEDMNTYSVAVASGYLALRNAQAYNDANEIGKLYSGDTVDVMNASDSTYWYVILRSLISMVIRTVIILQILHTNVMSVYRAVIWHFVQKKRSNLLTRSGSCIPEILYRLRIPVIVPTGWYMHPDLARVDM